MTIPYPVVCCDHTHEEVSDESESGIPWLEAGDPWPEEKDA